MSARPVAAYWGVAGLALILALGGLRGESATSADNASALLTDPSVASADTRSPSETVASSAEVMASATDGTMSASPGTPGTSALEASTPRPGSLRPDTAHRDTRQSDTPQADSQEPPSPSVTADDDRRRRYRRRYRNRYPGPIPTPEEWEPPEGPIRIALQAGHWRAAEAPSELSGLRDNGTRWNDIAEWEANLDIARRAGAMLDSLGYEVDILPAVVPPGYRAHLFISSHADGSGDPRASGYRVAAPRRDATGRADTMARLLQDRYGAATGLRHLTSATRRMRNYYAFNFRRYEHALHPMTIAVILETGFLTSARDRSVILDDPDRAAAGIVEAVRSFPVTARAVAADNP